MEEKEDVPVFVPKERRGVCYSWIYHDHHREGDRL